MTEVSSSRPRSDPASAAAYIATIAAELSRLAENHGLTTLAYILEMARLEAKGLEDDPRAGSEGGSSRRGGGT
ncbi:hypothetical protein K9U40_00950 [Xanthobacter autotrophicus]|uniref:hypothetical protein n=1 Tax=Xanthobacter TaxID=279 RepID=UPI0024ABF10D|nr:hypothetical protein [Xanthobacter autotrophicus]MDI4662912.1 hypothetical protein [Xanthobacter autotrophicus]